MIWGPFSAIAVDRSIEAGRLPDGDPDLSFRGFYRWNGEVGSKTLGMASFHLRAMCMNRNIWGTEDRRRKPSAVCFVPARSHANSEIGRGDGCRPIPHAFRQD